MEGVVAAGTRPAQFDATYAPTAAQARAVADYLTSRGFGAVTVAPNRMLVTATGDAATAEAAFDTSLRDFSVAGRTAFANVTAASVPSALAGDVTSVVGLQDLGGMHVATNPPSSCAVSGLGYPCTYNPQSFWKAYDATTAPTGSATPIAIFAEGDLTQVITDLRTEETANGLTQVPVTVVPTGPPSTDTSGTDEWDLDTQYSSGMAGSVSNLYVPSGGTGPSRPLSAARGPRSPAAGPVPPAGHRPRLRPCSTC